MSKKLFAILVLLTVVLLGAGVFSKDDTKKTDTSKPLSFSEMVGKPAPDFNLTSYDGNPFTLSQQRGKKVVIFFSEGVTCYPACWNQMVALGSEPKLNSAGVTTVTIVTDTADEWKQAVAKMPELGRGMILLDTDKQVSNKYGMLTLSSSMHRGSQPGHTYLIVDKDGVVRYTLDDPTMSVQNQILISELGKI